ncbi:type II secretion system protein GspM [Pantoea stewartii]|nr:type II secretion system protein GspM [Pantoea stewartii]KAB0556805.1 type II secretion system protein M [Pantoea stewartii subsp. stewartii]
MMIDLHRWRTPLIVLGVFIVLQGVAFWLLATVSGDAQTAASQLAWMQKQQDVVNWINHKPDSVAFSRPIVDAVAQSASSAVIALQSEVSHGETVQITLTGVEFNRLILWLQQLQQTYGTEVLELELTPAAAGEVNVPRLVLGRPPRVQ